MLLYLKAKPQPPRKASKSEGTRNLHLNWLILFSAIKISPRRRNQSAKISKIKKTFNGTAPPPQSLVLKESVAEGGFVVIIGALETLVSYIFRF